VKHSEEDQARGRSRLLPANSTRPLDVGGARRCVFLASRRGGAAGRTTLFLRVEVSVVEEQLRIVRLTVVESKGASKRAMVVLLGVVGGVASWASLGKSAARTPVRRLAKKRPKTPVDSSTMMGSTDAWALSATQVG
jgi:hypothetical protein